MAKPIFNFIFLILFWGYAIPSGGQNIPSKDQSQTEKRLQPVFQSSLGNVISNTLPVSMMKKLLDSALHARDKKGKTYAVTAFDFGYQQQESVINNTTGQSKTTHVYLYWHFQSNRLDSIWRKKVKDELKSGDQLFFDHIIAKDKDGTKYLAAPLHFMVK